MNTGEIQKPMAKLRTEGFPLRSGVRMREAE